MTVIANPVMVSLVRESKGWTQAELSCRAGLTQGHLSKVENGLIELSGSAITRVAEALGCPEQLLAYTQTRRGLEVSCMFHRRRQSKITVATGKRIEAIRHLTRISVDGLLDGGDVTATAPLVRLDLDSYEDPAQIAQMLRAC